MCESELRQCGNLLVRLAQDTAISPPASLRQRLLQSLRERPIPAEKVPSAVLLDKAGVVLLRTTKMQWQPGPIAGVSVKVIANDPKNDMTTILVRMAPGSFYPSHRHKSVEEVYILEGELRVEGVELREGDFCVSQPESIHQSSYSKAGCLLVVRASKHDEVIA